MVNTKKRVMLALLTALTMAILAADVTVSTDTGAADSGGAR